MDGQRGPEHSGRASPSPTAALSPPLGAAPPTLLPLQNSEARIFLFHNFLTPEECDHIIGGWLALVLLHGPAVLLTNLRGREGAGLHGRMCMPPTPSLLSATLMQCAGLAKPKLERSGVVDTNTGGSEISDIRTSGVRF